MKSFHNVNPAIPQPYTIIIDNTLIRYQDTKFLTWQSYETIFKCGGIKNQKQKIQKSYEEEKKTNSKFDVDALP